MSTLTTWLAAICLCIAVGASHHLDAGFDGQAERAQAQDIEQAQRDAEQAAKATRAAYALCKSEHGPNVLPVWTPDGQLVCQPKRGQATYIAQTGASQNLARAKGVRQQDETILKAAAKSDAAAFTEITP